MCKSSLIFFSAVVMAVVSLVGCRSTAAVSSRNDMAPVVFVCEHGSVKSLISASLFNQEAEA